MIVFGAGAFFNILFALALACIIWTTGLPTSNEQSTTRIGYVVDQLTTSEGQRVRSPASEAGLRIGDTVRAIDGRKTETWQELMQVLLTSAGRTTEGQREALFTIEREGKLIEVVVHPVIAGNEKDRRVGIAPGYELIVHGTTPQSLAAAAGFLPADRLVSLDGIAILNIQTYGEILARSTEREIHAVVQRGTTSVNLVIPARTAPKDPSDFGLTFTTERTLIYPNPLKQIGDVLGMTYHTFASLINPQSDVGISKLSGPVGIARVFHLAAQADIRYVIWFTILVNINLAVFNLLPIPVLDGGHMLFATIGKLLGRPLPASFVATAQSVFMILLFSMVIYVSFFDVRRWSREARAERAEQSVPAK
jgi:regulator of sigma E protease